MCILNIILWTKRTAISAYHIVHTRYTLQFFLSLVASIDNGVSLVLCICGIIGVFQQKYGPLKVRQKNQLNDLIVI